MKEAELTNRWYFVHVCKRIGMHTVVAPGEKPVHRSVGPYLALNFPSLPPGNYNPISTSKISNLHSVCASETAPSAALQATCTRPKNPAWGEAQEILVALQSLPEDCFQGWSHALTEMFQIKTQKFALVRQPFILHHTWMLKSIEHNRDLHSEKNITFTRCHDLNITILRLKCPEIKKIIKIRFTYFLQVFLWRCSAEMSNLSLRKSAMTSYLVQTLQ